MWISTYLFVSCGDTTRRFLYGRMSSTTTGGCLRLKFDESFTGTDTVFEGLMDRSKVRGDSSHTGLPVAWQRHPLGN